MRSVLTLCFTASLLLMQPSTHAADPRFNLQFSEDYRAEFLAEMRNMLGSVQGIMQGMGEGDRAKIAASARISGNRMARATPAEVRAGLPQAFRDLGGPTHLMMEELAIRAEADEMDELARFSGEIMQQCMACHALYRVN